MKTVNFFILLFFVNNTAYSQWSTDPNENLEVAVHGGNINIVPDGNGGAILTFNNFDYDVVTTYLQAVDKYGYLKWTEPRIFANSPGPKNYVQDIFINNDGTVSIGYISGYDSYDSLVITPHYNPYVQKIDSNGNKLWEEGGVSVKADTTSGYLGVIYCDDGSGGIFAFWGFAYETPPFGYTDSLYIQHISKDGERLWGEKGIFVADSVFGLNWIINDDNGGFITNYGEGLIEKYDSSGTLQWSINDRDYPEVIKDGYEGIILSDIKSTFPRQIIINRISSEGEKLWGQEGIIVDDSVDNSPPALLFLNFDNTVTIFWDTEWYPNDDLFLQRYTLEGEQVWGEHLKVSEYTSPKGRAGIVQSDNNSNIIVWGEFVGDSSGLYAQKIDQSGNPSWNEARGIMSHSPYDESNVITDGNYGAIIVWRIDPPWGGIYAQQISKNGNLGEVITSVKEDNIEPGSFYLAQNYPNPFNPTTAIRFTIPTSPLNPSPYQGEGNRERLILLKVYDVLGKEVATLVNEEKPAGSYEVEFDGSNLTSGIYIYRLTSGKFTASRKLILLK